VPGIRAFITAPTVSRKDGTIATAQANRILVLLVLIVSAGLLALSAFTFVVKQKDWRAKLAAAEAGESGA
jgi:hypothetical protein